MASVAPSSVASAASAAPTVSATSIASVASAAPTVSATSIASAASASLAPSAFSVTGPATSVAAATLASALATTTLSPTQAMEAYAALDNSPDEFIRRMFSEWITSIDAGISRFLETFLMQVIAY